MNRKSCKKQLNNEKSRSFKGKITKSYITFSENKPNSPNVQMNASLLITMNYAIFTSLTKVKNKPKQTQFWPIIRPIKAKQSQNKFILECLSRGANFRQEMPKIPYLQREMLCYFSFISAAQSFSASWAGRPIATEPGPVISATVPFCSLPPVRGLYH